MHTHTHTHTHTLSLSLSLPLWPTLSLSQSHTYTTPSRKHKRTHMHTQVSIVRYTKYPWRSDWLAAGLKHPCMMTQFSLHDISSIVRIPAVTLPSAIQCKVPRIARMRTINFPKPTNIGWREQLTYACRRGFKFSGEPGTTSRIVMCITGNLIRNCSGTTTKSNG